MCRLKQIGLNTVEWLTEPRSMTYIEFIVIGVVANLVVRIF